MASVEPVKLSPPTTTANTQQNHIHTDTQNHIHFNNQNQNQTLPPQNHILPNNNITSNNYINNGGSYNNNNSKKRSLDAVYLLENSPYFKIRALVNQLRPLILQAISSPQIETSEARHGIQEKTKLMVDLCRQPTTSLFNNGGVTLSSEKQGRQNPMQLPRDMKRFPLGNHADKQKHDNHRLPGSYIVGGSAFGWNFLMFHGTKPEYYGRTKEAFRAGQ